MKVLPSLFLHLLALCRFYSIANILSKIVVTRTSYLTVLSPIYGILFFIWLYLISVNVVGNLKGKKSKNVPTFKAINLFTICKYYVREAINILICGGTAELHRQHNILPRSVDGSCLKPLLQWKPLKGGDFCLHKTLQKSVLSNECASYNLLHIDEVLTKNGP